jgi:hypothetical protein
VLYKLVAQKVVTQIHGWGGGGSGDWLERRVENGRNFSYNV